MVNEINSHTEYSLFINEELEKQQKNYINTLREICDIVDENYYKAVVAFIKDEENGIWGNFKIVTETIGVWQNEEHNDEYECYWNILKGMFVNQSCGISGDDYKGTLEIKLNDEFFLRCSFTL